MENFNLVVLARDIDIELTCRLIGCLIKAFCIAIHVNTYHDLEMRELAALIGETNVNLEVGVVLINLPCGCLIILAFEILIEYVNIHRES